METHVRDYNIVISETEMVLMLQSYISVELSIISVQFKIILGKGDINQFLIIYFDITKLYLCKIIQKKKWKKKSQGERYEFQEKNRTNLKWNNKRL